MSRFFSEKFSNLIPYTPGEQPTDQQYIKLNTNESPFPPSPKAQAYAAKAAEQLMLYPDPECRQLRKKLAEVLNVNENEVLLTNGSDEILEYAFMAWCDEKHPAVFADITYGFYKVFADLYRLPCTIIPLTEDFTIEIDAYCKAKGTVIIANPNAPTGIALSPKEIETILQSEPDRLVIVDEAYVDFGGESCIPLIKRYDNLLVTGTFSKSRSMAGARLGFGVANPALLQDLSTLKYSKNPYNINRMTMAAGLGQLEDNDQTLENCQKIIQNRAFTTQSLKDLGFMVLESKTNFVFAKHPRLSGKYLYQKLKEQGILVRHFDTDRLSDYNRITIGSKEQMQTFIQTLQCILEEQL